MRYLFTVIVIRVAINSVAFFPKSNFRPYSKLKSQFSRVYRQFTDLDQSLIIPYLELVTKSTH